MTPNPLSGARGYARHAVAVAAVLATYAMARNPVLPEDARAELAARFAFQRQTLPTAGPVSSRTIRPVHPERARIRAWISGVGGAVALHDLDGDGLPNDACWVDTRSDQVVVTPVPGTAPRYATFALQAGGALVDPATVAPMGCLPGDLDEDGLADLVVYYWGRTPLAFLRRPGTAPAAASYSVQEVVPGGERWYTNAGLRADVDGDGHADLVFGNYFPDGSRVLDASASGSETMQHSMSRATNGGGDRLLLWQGREAGERQAVRYREAVGAFDQLGGAWTLAAAAADLDGDLLPELYFANDFGSDRLLHNRSNPGAPRFALLEGVRNPGTPRSKVLGRDSFKGMGADFADQNGDGVLDLFVSNLTSEYALQESNYLFQGTGDRTGMKNGRAPFVERAEELGLARSGWSWDARLADMDNDGVPEAMQAVGFLRGRTDRWPDLQELATGNDQLLRKLSSWPRLVEGDDLSGREPNTFFVRGEDGRYHNLAAEVGMGDPQVSRGLALADVDGDGRLDLATGNQWNHSYVYLNRAPRAGSFLGLHLLLPVGESATRAVAGHPSAATAGFPAIGAEAVVRLPDGSVRVAQVDGGNGHSGKRSPDLHFGLGAHPAGRPLDVQLRWRDATGRLREERLKLVPGWHTIILGQESRP